MKKQAVSLLYFSVFAPAAFEKFSAPETPKWFLDQFMTTPLGWIPAMLPIQFYGIAALESIAAVLMVLSLFTKNLRIFQSGLALSFFIFVALGFGQRLSHKFDGAAELFFYAVLTLLVYQSFFRRDKFKTVEVL